MPNINFFYTIPGTKLKSPGLGGQTHE